MVDPKSTNKTIDTGQNDNRITINNQNNEGQQQQRINLVENVMKNPNNGQDASQSEVAGNESDEMTMDNSRNETEEGHINRHEKSDIERRGLTIDMEFEGEISDEECVEVIIKVTLELVNQWKKRKVIEGIVAIDGIIMTTGFMEVSKWARSPRIIKNKKKTKVETMIEVVSAMAAYGLYQEEKEFCDQNRIRIGSKNTIMEYTKKIGFLVGTYVRLASPKHYISELSNILGTSKRVIDIKKGFTYEKGLRSRVLVVYAVEREA